MSEEEIIKQVDFITKWISKIGLIKEREAIQGLLDLYNKEKEKNKENIEALEEWINGERISSKCVSKDKIKKILEFYAYASADNPDETIAFYLDIRRLLEEGKK